MQPSLSKATWMLTMQGAASDKSLAPHISKLIIAGDFLTIASSIAEADDRKSRRYMQESTSFSPHLVINLSASLQDISSVVPVHILPGASDPAGPNNRSLLPCSAMSHVLPRFLAKQTQHRTIFTESELSNPKKSPIKRTLLIHSGHPLNDMFKYPPTPPNTRLSMLENTLAWQHMAPTAPDTLVTSLQRY